MNTEDKTKGLNNARVLFGTRLAYVSAEVNMNKHRIFLAIWLGITSGVSLVMWIAYCLFFFNGPLS